jgi:hypothetical protein
MWEPGRPVAVASPGSLCGRLPEDLMNRRQNCLRIKKRYGRQVQMRRGKALPRARRSPVWKNERSGRLTGPRQVVTRSFGVMGKSRRTRTGGPW